MKNTIILILSSILLIFIISGTIFCIHYINYRKAHPEMVWLEDIDDVDIKAGLQGQWDFDEISDNFTPDLSGNNNHGSLDSFCSLSGVNIVKSPKLIDGKKNKAFKFNGKNWISFGNKKVFCSEEFTISVWVYRYKNESTMVPTIMAKSAWPLDGWWLCTKPYTKYIDMGIAWGNGFTHLESGYELPSEEWHHIAVTMDNINHEVQFYIDGKVFGPKHSNVPLWLVNWNHELFIGGYDGSSRWGWHGLIDDSRYYNKILNPKEIELIYLSNS